MNDRLPGGHYLGSLVRRRTVAGITLSETRYAPRTRLPRHRHEHGYFCLVRRGSYREEYDGRVRCCEPLTVAYHPPGEWHAEEFGADEVWSFNVELAPSWPRSIGLTAPLDRPFDSRGEPVRGLAAKLFREFDRPDAASPLIIEGLALELLGYAARGTRGATGASLPAWLLRARDRLVEDVAAPGLAQLATEVGVHPGHLATEFRRAFGCTVGEFIRSHRLARAAHAVANSDVPLADVALAAGFADQSHLTRAFRAAIGVTPAAYRREAHSKR